MIHSYILFSSFVISLDLLSKFLIRMSVALNAALIDEDQNDKSNYITNKKRSMHNRTQKRFPDQLVDNNKVKQVLQSIHNQENENMDDVDSNLGELGDYANFNPPNPPISQGAQRAMRERTQEGMSNIKNVDSQSLGSQPLPAQDYGDEKLSALNNFQSNYGDSSATHEYYKRFIPQFSNIPDSSATKLSYQEYQPSQQINNNSQRGGVQQGYGQSQDVLIEKLNYMIHLLEEHHDEKTHSVTEEVILYSFLGIFIIFIVDSFTRIGKYKR